MNSEKLYLVLVVLSLFVGITYSASVGSSNLGSTLKVSLFNASSQYVEIGQASQISSVVYGGVPPYTYQWLYNFTTTNGSAFNNATRLCSTTSTCNFTADSTSRYGTYQFELKVTDSQGASAISNVSNITVLDWPLLFINGNKGSATITAGQTINLTTRALDPPSTYNEFKFAFYNITVKGNNVTLPSTATCVNPVGPQKTNTSTCSFISSQAGTFKYDVELTYYNKNGGITASYFNQTGGVTLTVKAATPPLSVSLSSSASTIDVGQNATFSSNVVGGTTPYSYQWYNSSSANSVTISGATSQIYKFVPTTNGTFKYYLKVTGGSSVISNTIIIQVNPQLTASNAKIAPANPSIEIGQNVILSVSVSGGTTPYTYTWYINGNVVGTNSATYNYIGNSSTLGTKQVTVKVTDSVTESATSSPDSLTVSSGPSFGSPAVSITNTSIVEGQTTKFTANVVGGNAPYTYKWSMGSIVFSSNTNLLTFNGNSSTLGTDTVNVVVTDKNGQMASASATVIVSADKLSAPTTPILSNQTVDQGQLSVVSGTIPTSGIGTYSYKWLVSYNGGSFISANTECSSLVSAKGILGGIKVVCNFVTTTSTSIGNYTFELYVNDSLGTFVVSPLAKLLVNAQLADPIAPASQTIDRGMNATVTETIVGGSAPYTYSWYEQKVGSSNFVNASCTVSSTPTNSKSSSCTVQTSASSAIGTYLLKAHTSDSASSPMEMNSLTANVVVNSDPTVTAAVGNAITTGESENFTVKITGGTGPFRVELYNLTANAIQGNAITLGSGVRNYTFTIKGGSAGNFTYNAIVIDGGVTPNYVVNSLPLKVVVNGILGAPAIIASGTKLDVGQVGSLIANVVSTSGPFTYSWTYVNSESNTIVLGSNTVALGFNANASTIGNDTVKLSVKDSFGNLQIASMPVEVRNASVSISPALASLTVGSSQTLSINVSGGFGPFNVQVYNQTTSSAVASNLIIQTPYASNSVSLVMGSVGDFNFSAIVSDEGTSTSFIFSSINALITVNAAPSNNNPTNGGGSTGGGGGGGGGSSLPTVTESGSCYQISNFSTGVENIKLNGQLFTITENFIAQSQAEVSVDNTSYALSANQSVNYTQNGKVYTLTLDKILLVPLNDRTVVVSFCAAQPQSNQQPPLTNTTKTPPTVSITINNSVVTVTTTNKNNTVVIMVNNKTVATGKGTAAYNTGVLPAGSYTIVGKDVNASIQTAGKQYTKASIRPVLKFVKECTNSTFNGSSCTTTAMIIGDGSLKGTLYLNGVKIGTTASMINSTQTKPGKYDYIFNTTGDGNYSAASISYSYVVANTIASVAKNGTSLTEIILLVLLLLLILFLLWFFLVAKRRKKEEKQTPTDTPATGTVPSTPTIQQ